MRKLTECFVLSKDSEDGVLVGVRVKSDDWDSVTMGDFTCQHLICSLRSRLLRSFLSSLTHIFTRSFPHADNASVA